MKPPKAQPDLLNVEVLFKLWRNDPRALATVFRSPEQISRVWTAFVYSLGRARILRVIGNELTRLATVLSQVAEGPTKNHEPEELALLAQSTATVLADLAVRIDAALTHEKETP